MNFGNQWGQGGFNQPGLNQQGLNQPGFYQQGFGQMGGLNQPGFGQQNLGGLEVNRIYRITSAGDRNMCLDSSGSSYNKRKAILYTFHGGLNQRFRLISDGQGNYGLVNLQSNGTLQIPDQSNAKPGVQLHVSQSNGTINEKWKIVPNGGGYMIQSAFNGLVVDVQGQDFFEDTPIILYNAKGSINQTWLFEPISE